MKNFLQTYPEYREKFSDVWLWKEVTDFILRRARQLYGASVSKEDIFYYVYGFLHLPSYREKFSAELKKSLPKIFLVDDVEKFW